MLGVTGDAIRKINEGLGSAGAATEDRSQSPTRYFMPEWLRAWARHSVGGVLDEDGEIDSPGRDSKWLEEKRKWSAKRERTKYEAEIGQVIPLPQVRQGYAIVGAHIRRACESVGPECRAAVESGLEQAAIEMSRVFPAGNDDDSSNDSNASV